MEFYRESVLKLQPEVDMLHTVIVMQIVFVLGLNGHVNKLHMEMSPNVRKKVEKNGIYEKNATPPHPPHPHTLH